MPFLFASRANAPRAERYLGVAKNPNSSPSRKSSSPGPAISRRGIVVDIGTSVAKHLPVSGELGQREVSRYRERIPRRIGATLTLDGAPVYRRCRPLPRQPIFITIAAIRRSVYASRWNGAGPAGERGMLLFHPRCYESGEQNARAPVSP